MLPPGLLSRFQTPQMHPVDHQVRQQVGTVDCVRGVSPSFFFQIFKERQWPGDALLLLHTTFLFAYVLLRLWQWYTTEVSEYRAALYSQQPRRRKESGLLWKVALSCCLLLLFTNLGLLLCTWYIGGSWQSLSVHVVSALAWVAMCTELLVIRLEGRPTFPPILRAWWLTSFALVLLCISKDVTTFRKQVTVPWASVVHLASFPAWLALFLAGLVGTSGLQFDEDTDSQESLLGNHNPKVPSLPEGNVSLYRKVGVIGRVTFSWLNPLLAVGARKPLELDDIPQQPEEDRAEPTYDRMIATWDKLRIEAPGEAPSLYKVVILTFWKEILYAGALQCVGVPMGFVGPVLLQYFVEYVGGKTHFPYEVYILPLCLCCSKLVENVANGQISVRMQSLGLQIRLALSAHVYKKGLKLSSLSRQSHTSGEIANYMTVDVERIGSFCYYLHDVWIIPVQIVLALAVLYKVVEMATVAALATTIILAAGNAPLGKLQKKLQDRVMAAKDERMKATSETLRNMRVLKLQAWEVRFMKKLENLRKIEYGWLRLDQLLEAVMIFVFYSVPSLVAVATFGTCVLLHVPLTAGRVFSALATFRTLQMPLIMVPELISTLAMTIVSMNRLQSFFMETELAVDAVEHIPEEATNMAVEIEAGTFAWDECSEKPTLTGVNLRIRKGQHVAVCGSVGSGKSSLLSCILGEMSKLSGTVKLCGKTAYVAQSAWIQSGKIVNNICFGRRMDVTKYRKVLEACALTKDLESLPFQDQTEIGERGINLSGGQKQRIQIARALYQDADVYLLDDPFSAVDAQTGSILFKECVLGVMAAKTVIYVTHQIEFLPPADIIVVMRDGEIVQAGKFEELIQVGTDFGSLVSAHNAAISSVPRFEKLQDVDVQVSHMMSNGSSQGDTSSIHIGTAGCILSEIDAAEQEQEAASSQAHMVQLVQEEERERGRVTFDVYWAYITSYLHGATIPFLLLAQFLFQALSIASNWWIGWATPATENQEIKTSMKQLMVVFTCLSLASAFFIAVRAVLMVITGVGIAQKFYGRMLRSIFRAPMSFFDCTPTGRILSRASSDQSCLDSDFPLRLSGFATMSINLAGAIFVLACVTWEVLLVFFPVAIVCVRLQRYCMVSARELSRITGILKAPILHHYTESVAGAATVRGFDQQHRFSKANLDLLDQYSRPYFNQFVASEWLNFRFELLSNAVFGCSMLVLLSLPHGVVDPSMAGLALSYGLTLNTLYSWWLWQLTNMENKVISVERIKQYTCIPSEAPLVIEDSCPSKEWPMFGNVELLDLKVRYSSTSPLVLRGINCVFEGGQKIGIVGRTGSGKSTLIQTLFRLVEPDDGKIVIDGVDIASIGLHDLRCKLSIIPQDPTLFEGDLRSNLDPLGEHSDAKLWEALSRCHLENAVRAKDEKLDAPVHENGENWSMGQRQLISLGRALLKNTRILVLDEATASVDSVTDNLIQKTIREEFSDCTVLTVAHRIPTVMDSDKILVLHDGTVGEYDTPVELLADSSSMFTKLVSEYTQRSRSTSDLRILALTHQVASS